MHEGVKKRTYRKIEHVCVHKVLSLVALIYEHVGVWTFDGDIKIEVNIGSGSVNVPTALAAAYPCSQRAVLSRQAL
jgi:uncharacterized protein (DUF58 family)